MSAKKPLLVLLPLLALWPAGCTIIERNYAAPIDTSLVRFEEGRTRCSEVVATLGPPTAISALPSGAAVTYEHLTTLERQIGIGLFDYLKVSLGRAAADRVVLTLTFDREGRLMSQAWDQRAEELGSGGSVELAVSVTSVVDTSDLAKDFAPHGWGALMLRPLDETLNAASSLYAGSVGVAQVGAARGVGQHTLEWAR